MSIENKKAVLTADKTLVDLEYDIDAMIKEYLLWSGDIQNRVIPTTAFPNRWRTIHRKTEILNKDLQEKNYHIKENGIRLQQSYDTKKERRKYLHDILIRLLSPAAKPNDPFDGFIGRYHNQTAYTENEHERLDALTLCLEKIFIEKEIPKRFDFFRMPSELQVYLAYLRKYYHPLRDIISRFWHGTLKKGDSLTEFFRNYEKNEILSAFRWVPFPALFHIEKEEIILNEISDEIFLFLLSGLMANKVINQRAAWKFYIAAYFYCYSKGVL